MFCRNAHFLKFYSIKKYQVRKVMKAYNTWRLLSPWKPFPSMCLIALSWSNLQQYRKSAQLIKVNNYSTGGCRIYWNNNLHLVRKDIYASRSLPWTQRSALPWLSSVCWQQGMELRWRVLPYIGHTRGRLFSNKSTYLHNLEWKFIFSKGEGKPAVWASWYPPPPPPQIN